MTSSLLDEVAAAPEPEVDPADEWGQVILDKPEDEKPKRRGRPRKPRPIDPETGQEVEPPKRTYQPRANKLKEELLEPFVEFASDISFVAPTAAGVLIVRAEKTVDGIVDLAQGHPRVLNALKRTTQAGKGVEVITTILLLIVAAAVDLGRIPAASPILDHLGHSEIVRDDNGRAKKDTTGRLQKERTSLRDIYNKMHPDAGMDIPGPPPMPESFSPETGMQPLRMPIPMNNLWAETSNG